MMIIRFVLTLILMALPTIALAQLGFGGNEIILVDAKKATYKGSLTILSGNVDVKQGDVRINSDTMDLFRDERKSANADSITSSLQLGNISKIIAKGNFKYTSPENIVTGDEGVYERISGILTVTGNVTVIQPGGNKASTEKLVYNLKNDTIRFGDNCMGANCNGRSKIQIKPQ